MSLKVQKFMIITAVVLIALAVVGVVFVVLSENGVFDKKPEVTTLESETEKNLDDAEWTVETTLDEYGFTKSEMHYADGEYQFRYDYVYDSNRVNKIMWDNNDKIIQNERFEVNEVGSNTLYLLIDGENAVLSGTGYEYYDDNVTLWKELSFVYDEEAGIYEVTKKTFNEMGKVKELYTFEATEAKPYLPEGAVNRLKGVVGFDNSKQTSHIVYTYDENGELLSEEEVVD